VPHSAVAWLPPWRWRISGGSGGWKGRQFVCSVTVAVAAQKGADFEVAGARIGG
jgi:hypothetical protein